MSQFKFKNVSYHELCARDAQGSCLLSRGLCHGRQVALFARLSSTIGNGERKSRSEAVPIAIGDGAAQSRLGGRRPNFKLRHDGDFVKFLLLAILFVVSCFLSLFYGGSEDIGLKDFSSDHFIFWHLRLPKTATAIIAGCTLSVSGLILQIIFRNPLAGPFVLGISSGAALMVALSLLAGQALHLFSVFFLGKSVVVVSAIVGSFLITFLILAISKRVSSNVVLLLIGLMLSQICGAVQTALEYFSDPNSLKSFVIWGMGSLSNTTGNDLLMFIPIAVACLVTLLFFVKPLNALLLGQNYAQNVGINFNRSRFYLIMISSVLTGLTTAFCGPIAFIGTAVPILSRMIFTTSRQQVHFFSCILIGSILLLFSDALCNSLIENVSLPINMITTFIGAPLVIYLMFRNKHW